MTIRGKIRDAVIYSVSRGTESFVDCNAWALPWDYVGESITTDIMEQTVEDPMMWHIAEEIEIYGESFEWED